ncbi:hypothetical protein BDV97DRAFT_32167 [Delphinella strobiligena]|nr:hypothetical protein BDV97DRAFT_32167 [Delphinella strobiligena]
MIPQPESEVQESSVKGKQCTDGRSFACLVEQAQRVIIVRRMVGIKIVIDMPSLYGIEQDCERQAPRSTDVSPREVASRCYYVHKRARLLHYCILQHHIVRMHNCYLYPMMRVAYLRPIRVQIDRAPVVRLAVSRQCRAFASVKICGVHACFYSFFLIAEYGTIGLFMH